MEFIQIFSGDVKEGKTKEMVAWLKDHESEIHDQAPEGTEYLGTYFAVSSSEKGMGSAFTLWRLDSYGAQDRMAALSDTPLGKLFNDFVDFFDQRNDAKGGQILLKKVTDATLWGSDI